MINAPFEQPWITGRRWLFGPQTRWGKDTYELALRSYQYRKDDTISETKDAK
jgi:hypothetical protein